VFQSSRFHDEEFSLLWHSPDASVLAMQFIIGIMAAPASDPDTLSYEQAMRAPDAEQFRQSAVQELRDLLAAKTWTVVDKRMALTKILPGIWVFKRKRNPGTGEVKRHKGR
jgi:hypothetical protein